MSKLSLDWLHLVKNLWPRYFFNYLADQKRGYIFVVRLDLIVSMS